VTVTADHCQSSQRDGVYFPLECVRKGEDIIREVGEKTPIQKVRGERSLMRLGLIRGTQDRKESVWPEETRSGDS